MWVTNPFIMPTTPTNKSIYDKLLQLIPNLPQHLAEGREAGKSESPPFMDLSYDFLNEDSPGKYVIALSHHYEMNGDLVPDLDMEILVIPERGTADALTCQNSTMHQSVRADDERRHELQQKMNEFLDQWLTNALAQDHCIIMSENVREREEAVAQEKDESEREKKIDRKPIGKKKDGKNDRDLNIVR